jgi:hypothetical protein
MLIHETHTIAQLIKFKPDRKVVHSTMRVSQQPVAFVSAMSELEAREPNRAVRLAFDRVLTLRTQAAGPIESVWREEPW